MSFVANKDLDRPRTPSCILSELSINQQLVNFHDHGGNNQEQHLEQRLRGSGTSVNLLAMFASTSTMRNAQEQSSVEEQEHLQVFVSTITMWNTQERASVREREHLLQVVAPTIRMRNSQEQSSVKEQEHLQVFVPTIRIVVYDWSHSGMKNAWRVIIVSDFSWSPSVGFLCRESPFCHLDDKVITTSDICNPPFRPLKGKVAPLRGTQHLWYLNRSEQKQQNPLLVKKQQQSSPFPHLNSFLPSLRPPQMPQQWAV